MKFVDNVVCPISNVKFDVNRDRIAVFFNVLLMISFIVTRNPIFLMVVLIDYIIRGMDRLDYSPTTFLATFLNKFLKIPPKMTDIAPKIFSYRLGVFASSMALIFHFSGLTFPSIMASSVLVTLMALDSIVGICVGCFVYTYSVLPFYKRKLNI